MSSYHPRGASIGTVHPFRHKTRRQFQGAALSAKEAKLRQLLLQGLQSGHRLGVVGGVTDVFLGETSEIFKQGKGAEARSTVCDVEKNTLVEFLFFFSSPALPLRCVPGKGAQKGPTISMKSLVNHIAQHEYLITLSTYGLQALMEDGYLEGVPREVGTSEISGKSGVQRMFLFQGEN